MYSLRERKRERERWGYKLRSLKQEEEVGGGEDIKNRINYGIRQGD